jgi:hypothetical protein
MKTLSQNWVLAALAATWLAAQNVGIGTTTPITRLHVAEGDIFLGDAAGANGFVLHSGAGAGYDYFQISTRTGGTYEWSKGITLVRSSGNVGIGTTTPLTTLHAAYSSNSLQRGIISSNYVNSGVGGKIFILKGRGTVASPLPVLGGDQLGVLAFGGYFGTGVSDFEDHAAIIADATEDWSLTSRGSRLRFTTTPNGSNTPQTRVTIDQDGNVGIGTTTPEAKLEVAGAIKVPQEGTLLFNDPNEAGTPAGDGFRIRYEAHFYGLNKDALIIEKTDRNQPDPDGGISFVNTGEDGVVEPALTIRGSGNVGIGITLPAYRLHVVGHVFATGVVYCNSTALCSDQRWKTNIKPIQNALDNVLKIQGVTYYWKVDEYPDKHFPEGEQVGFIAQEIEKVYPQVVLTDKDGYKSVDYSKLTPILVEAIKEQQKIIEELQKVIQQLQEENSQIKQANAQLSAEIKMLNEKVDNLINSLSNDKKLGYR